MRSRCGHQYLGLRLGTLLALVTPEPHLVTMDGHLIVRVRRGPIARDRSW